MTDPLTVLLAGRSPAVRVTGRRPRAVDLFCGGGGMAMGLHRAGFDVTGVDLAPQPRFPFEFILADALALSPDFLRRFSMIHASPPCQGYSRLRHLPWLRGRTWPLLIDATRELLAGSGCGAWCIENVEGAPLAGITLCGAMFGLPTYRHRRFETSFLCMVPPHPTHVEVVGRGRGVNDRKRGTLNAGSGKGAWGAGGIVTVAGGQFRKADGERALGIDWMTKAELAQAIPPAYGEFVGRAALAALGLPAAPEGLAA